jgi:hypothetical protein
LGELYSSRSLGFVTLQASLNGGLADGKPALLVQYPHIHIEIPPRWTCAVVYGGDEMSTTNIGFTAIVQHQAIELHNRVA